MLVIKDNFALDIACSQYLIHDRTVFISYQILNSPQKIKSYAGSLKAIGTGQILLLCNVCGNLTQIGFIHVLHIPDTLINLISYR